MRVSPGVHEQIQIADDILFNLESKSLSFHQPMLHESVLHSGVIGGVVKPGAKARSPTVLTCNLPQFSLFSLLFKQQTSNPPTSTSKQQPLRDATSVDWLSGVSRSGSAIEKKEEGGRKKRERERSEKVRKCEARVVSSSHEPV